MLDTEAIIDLENDSHSTTYNESIENSIESEHLNESLFSEPTTMY